MFQLFIMLDIRSLPDKKKNIYFSVSCGGKSEKCHMYALKHYWRHPSLPGGKLR